MADDCPAGLDEPGRWLWYEATMALQFPAVQGIAVGIRQMLTVEARARTAEAERDRLRAIVRDTALKLHDMADRDEYDDCRAVADRLTAEALGHSPCEPSEPSPPTS